jgi:nucleotide-binding universal stress UspA family protein
MSEAIRLAAALGARLRFFHVIDLQLLQFDYGGGSVVAELIDTLNEAGRQILDEAMKAASLAGASAEAGSAEALGSRAADAILAEARRWKADLIVLGTLGRRGVRRLVLGSDAESVVREAPAAVLLIRTEPSGAAAPLVHDS